MAQATVPDSPVAPRSLFAILLPLIGFVIAVAGLTIAIVQANDGVFSYTLDDPYIHLAVAENIARGHYGVNLQEPSSPSSSIGWTFALAPLAGTLIGDFAPLIYNVLAGAGLILILDSILRRALPRSNGIARALLIGALLLALNIVPLVFYGMEHVLQVMLTALLIDGILRERDARQPAVLIAACIAAPLVRYEMLALSGLALLWLMTRGRWRAAIAAGVVIVVCIVGFSAFLLANGLGVLPSSVQARSTFSLVPLIGWRETLSYLVTSSFTNRQVLTVLLMTAGLALIGLLRRPDRGIAWVVAGAGAAQVAIGQFGFPYRYEIYMVLALLLLWVIVGRKAIERLPSIAFAGAAVVLLGVVFTPYVTNITRTVAGARNIYLQQYQMHRFVTEFHRGAVAINDLGWVSYRNDNYVLDLWGLASPEALSLRLYSRDLAWMEPLLAERAVAVALVYDSYFFSLRRAVFPESWKQVATLHLDEPIIYVVDDRVLIWATTPEAVEPLRARLADFAPTLPQGARIVFTDAGDGQGS